MIRIQLSPEELAYLEQTRRARRSQVAERCHYVLLNAAGYQRATDRPALRTP